MYNKKRTKMAQNRSKSLQKIKGKSKNVKNQSWESGHWTLS